MLRFDLSTPLERLQNLLSEFERLLLNNNNFYTDIYRIRLIAITNLGYEVEVYSFAKTTEWRVFAAVREELFLAIWLKWKSWSEVCLSESAYISSARRGVLMF